MLRAFHPHNPLRAASAAGAPPGGGFEFVETFEGSEADDYGEVGYDNVGWVTDGYEGRNPNSTPAYAGSNSLAAERKTDWTGTPFPASEIHFYFAFLGISPWAGGGGNVARLSDVNGNTLAAPRFGKEKLDGSKEMGYESAFGRLGACGFFIWPDTWYHCWMRVKVGTGSDGEVEIYYSTTPTKPAIPQIFDSDKTFTNPAVRVEMGRGGNNHNVRSDNIVISTSEIASNPV